jgi:uncharacterized protein YggU (UPF0235/DUF167 family)
VTAASPALRHAAGHELAVKVTPRAGRSMVAGIATDAAGHAWLAVKVTAAPESDRANNAVLALLARSLAVPCSSCRVIAGATSRWKRILVDGDGAELGRRLAARVAADA